MRAWLTPRMVGAAVLMLVCVGAAAGLGIWQYDAWSARRVAETVDLTKDPPVPLGEVIGPNDPFPGDRVGQPVEVAGTWLGEATVLIADREHEGAQGYWVVTPLTSGGADAAAVPVVRGWVADPDDTPAAPSGPGAVDAWLQPSEGTGAPDDDPTDDIFPQLRVADLVQRVTGDLYSGYVVAEPDQADPTAAGTAGLEPADLESLPPASRFTALRNLLYALEWWVFGGFAAFIWWRFVREERAEQPDPATPDPVASGT